MLATLYTIHHSPWSERARWALGHHRVSFDEKPHTPLLGEPALRLRAKRWGKVSVPLLVDDDGTVVEGSLAIAEHVDAKHGAASGQTTLFPAEARERIRGLYETLEPALDAARARHVSRLAVDREGQIAALPPFLRTLPFAAPLARFGAGFIARKYDARADGVDERMHAGLRVVREALAGKPYATGAFTFADVLGASVVQTIEPVADAYLKLPAATRRVWTHDALRREFADLVAWRDGVYRQHR